MSIPGAGIRFFKYHALGNDYLVLDDNNFSRLSGDVVVRLICHRNFGVGSDGLLMPSPSEKTRFAVRIINPDGSEAEKSGNGLRIFARYLWDQKLVDHEPFVVSTAGGFVTCEILKEGKAVKVDMGRVSFNSRDIPVQGPPREVLGENLRVAGELVTYSAATIGNPHCVVVRNDVSEADAKRLGPFLEKESRFPNRTNVQFLQVINRDRLRIEIWERGAGYTLASGSSSCAAAAVARRLGLCNASVTVAMPGGELEIELGDDFRALMTGPVVQVAEGLISRELLAQGQ